MKIRNVIIVLFAIAIIVNLGCKEKKQARISSVNDKVKTVAHVDSASFVGNVDGKSVNFYRLRNKNKVEATFTNYGQRLISLYVPDNEGRMEDVVLGFNSLKMYQNANEKYFGATIGRYGNRIAKGKFTIQGQAYQLATNNNSNHLHGGVKGFNEVVWEADQISENEIEFHRISPHMEEGYPGNLNVKVNYILTDENELRITYEATTDRSTPVNLTHHSFFNLRGEGNGTINEHILMINANQFTPVDKGLIPTGEMRSVEGTPFDFSQPKPIGQDLETENQQLIFGMGYDHNFVLNDTPKSDSGLTLAARVIEPESGRVMEVFTNEPGLQFYGGNFLNGEAVGKSGKPYTFRGAFCLETQHFPDSPNHSNFPNTLLEPGETYNSICVYKFTNTTIH
ncbi:aldose epimerase family protein [Galbibacter mesophilus]|uniref:aldose epimerase family protein n=1 Tax=Galbibacter mesophilus TaxID=379069 RepID=UPI00191FE664|nr:aldose epimerase family protein [Galbibacter mesophilus]MCM5661803.1 galactose mutarotase [Galbibacter mesophilus]